VSGRAYAVAALLVLAVVAGSAGGGACGLDDDGDEVAELAPRRTAADSNRRGC